MEIIQSNVDAMNQLVAEGVGYINSDYEFVVSEGEEYFQQFSTWRFKLRWNKVSANYYRDFTIVMGFVFLALKIAAYFVPSPAQMGGLLSNESEIVRIIREFPTWCPDAMATCAGLFSNASISSMVAVMTVAAGILSAASAFASIYAIVVNLLLPSIYDCVIVLCNALRLNRGMQLTACWWATSRDTLGVSLRTI